MGGIISWGFTFFSAQMVISISHRMKFLEKADEVVVIEEGREVD